MMQHIPFISDENLRATILAIFADDNRTARADLRAGVLNGIVHLAGTVDFLAERTAAEELAKKVPGVRAVVNRIEAPGAPSPARVINLVLENTPPSKEKRSPEMTKSFSKWFRKFHRWIAVPTALLIPVAVIIKLVGNPQTVAAWEKLDKIPSILMLIMAISGSYLFLLPYIVKGQRKKKKGSPSGSEQPTVAPPAPGA